MDKRIKFLVDRVVRRYIDNDNTLDLARNEALSNCEELHIPLSPDQVSDIEMAIFNKTKDTLIRNKLSHSTVYYNGKNPDVDEVLDYIFGNQEIKFSS